MIKEILQLCDVKILSMKKSRKTKVKFATWKETEKVWCDKWKITKKDKKKHFKVTNCDEFLEKDNNRI